jgi:hypothetical protein
LVFSEIHFRRQRERANYVELKNYGDATTSGASSAKGKGGRVTVIRFPKDNVAAIYEEVRRVLEREGLMPVI